MKLIGLLTAWAAEPFIEPALKQGIQYCDELVVAVYYHHPAFKKYEDNTLKICKGYKDKIRLIDVNVTANHPQAKGIVLKRMLDETGNNKKGRWIWILDADEFYFKEDVDVMRGLMQFSDKISIWERYFLVNMSYCVRNSRTRIKKLQVDNSSFRTNKLKVEGGIVSMPPVYYHHYSLLMNPKFKREFWRHEYGVPAQKKIDWLDNVYLKKDPDKITLGPLAKDFKASEKGTPFDYKGKHPEFIEQSGLAEIKDFRTIYD